MNKNRLIITAGASNKGIMLIQSIRCGYSIVLLPGHILDIGDDLIHFVKIKGERKGDKVYYHTKDEYGEAQYNGGRSKWMVKR